MSAWNPRRFWALATVSETESGFGVLLDARPVRTPAKAFLAVPTQALANALAAEWNAQEGSVNPATMPFTRTANSAIDKVAPQQEAVVKRLVEYGDTDLTCYRAPGPEALVLRQAGAWDPLLDWAAQTYGSRLIPVVGVIPQPQSAAALRGLAEPVRAMSSFQLAAFHDLVALSGSLVIGLAAVCGIHSGPELWDRSRIDENWQREQWGRDAEADQMAEAKRAGFLVALEFYSLAEENV